MRLVGYMINTMKDAGDAEAHTALKEIDDQLIDLSFVYHPPSADRILLGQFPSSDLAKARSLIHFLEGEKSSTTFDDHQWRRNYRFHASLLRFHRTIYWSKPFMAGGAILAIAIFISLVSHMYTRETKTDDHVGSTLLTLALLNGIFGYVYLMAKDASYYRFFRLVKKVENIARDQNPLRPIELNLVECINHSGNAARSLFRVLQGDKRTWVSPPAVSDRALALSHPLTDVIVDDHASSQLTRETLEHFARFLRQGALLVAVQRADLIPRLRECYHTELLPMRPKTEDGQIAQRDALFLDPMRDYDRWAVIRDYLYPLGTWLSFLVSLTALVITLIR